MFPPGPSPPGARKPCVRLAQNIPPDVDHKLLCGIPAGYGDTRFWGLHDCKTPHCRKTPPVRGRRSDPDHHPLKLCCSGPKRTMTDCLGHPVENLHWVLDTYYFISTCDHNKVCQVIYAVPEYQLYFQYHSQMFCQNIAQTFCQNIAQIFCQKILQTFCQDITWQGVSVRVKPSSFGLSPSHHPL